MGKSEDYKWNGNKKSDKIIGFLMWIILMIVVLYSGVYFGGEKYSRSVRVQKDISPDEITKPVSVAIPSLKNEKGQQVKVFPERTIELDEKSLKVTTKVEVPKHNFTIQVGHFEKDSQIGNLIRRYGVNEKYVTIFTANKSGKIYQYVNLGLYDDIEKAIEKQQEIRLKGGYFDVCVQITTLDRMQKGNIPFEKRESYGREEKQIEIKKQPEKVVKPPVVPEKKEPLKVVEEKKTEVVKQIVKDVSKPVVKTVEKKPEPVKTVVDTYKGPYYGVQIGSFGLKENADEIAKKLKDAGFEVDVSPAGDLFRVIAGKEKTRENAEKLGETLVQKKLSAKNYLVKPLE